MADLNDQTGNVSLHNETTDAAVTTTTDGAKERLDVTLGDEQSFQLQAFTPKSDFSVASTLLNTSTDTTLKLVTGTVGKVMFIAIAGSNSNYQVSLAIDGVVPGTITMTELGSDLGLSNATNVPLWVETANKNFRFHPTQAVDFTDSFEIIVKASGTPAPTVNWIVMWREAQ